MASQPKKKRGVKPTVLREDWVREALKAIRKHRTIDIRIDDVARALKITKGSFYNYFKNRDELIEAALLEWCNEENAIFARLAQFAPKDPYEVVRGFYRSLSQHPLHLIFFLCSLPANSRYRKLLHQIQTERFRAGHLLMASVGIPDHLVEPLALMMVPHLLGLTFLDLNEVLELPSIRRKAPESWRDTEELMVLLFRHVLESGKS